MSLIKKKLCPYIYLAQSRRIAKLFIKPLLGKSHWTNYTGWEYTFSSNTSKEGIELELAYTNDRSETMRFHFIQRVNRKTLLKTNSLRDAITFIHINKA